MSALVNASYRDATGVLKIAPLRKSCRNSSLVPCQTARRSARIEASRSISRRNQFLSNPRLRVVECSFFAQTANFSRLMHIGSFTRRIRMYSSSAGIVFIPNASSARGHRVLRTPILHGSVRAGTARLVSAILDDDNWGFLPKPATRRISFDIIKVEKRVLLHGRKIRLARAGG